MHLVRKYIQRFRTNNCFNLQQVIVVRVRARFLPPHESSLSSHSTYWLPSLPSMAVLYLTGSESKRPPTSSLSSLLLSLPEHSNTLQRIKALGGNTLKEVQREGSSDGQWLLPDGLEKAGVISWNHPENIKKNWKNDTNIMIYTV